MKISIQPNTMLRTLIVLLFLFLSTQTFAQRRGGHFEIGPMFNLEYSTIYVNTGELVITNTGEVKEEWKDSGYDTNFSGGVYGMYYFESRIALGAELYYDKITSTEFGSENYYTSITFLPFINLNFIESVENLYFGAGGGVSFIQETPEYGSEVDPEDIREITIPLKLSASYRFKNRITFETGVHGEILGVVKDLARRNSFFVGVKIPINRILTDARYL